VFLSGSAIGIYGDAGDELLTESSPLAGDFAAQLCRDWEAAALPAQPLGVRVCLLRTGTGAWGLRRAARQNVIAIPAWSGRQNWGDGKQWMSWISLADYMDLVLMLLENSQASGAFNLTAPQPVTNGEFTRAMARAVRRPAFFAVPSFVLNKALGERAPLVFGRPARVTSASASAGFCLPPRATGRCPARVAGRLTPAPFFCTARIGQPACICTSGVRPVADAAPENAV
jgi:uncharacterized protein (TIGR01777 family)